MVLIALLLAVLARGCAKKPDDAAIVTDIKSQMFSSVLLKSSDLQVASSKGEVSLVGTVGSEAARQEAYKLASQTPGVVGVSDQIIVEVWEGPGPLVQAPSIPAGTPVVAVSPSRKPRERGKSDPSEETDLTQSAQNPSAPPAKAAPDPAVPVAPPAQTAAAVPAAPPPLPPQPRQVVIPANSSLIVRMIAGVDSKVNHAGEIFHASLDAPLIVDVQVVVPQGTDIYVRLSAASSAGHMTGRSELHMELLQLEFQGRSYPLVSSTYSAVGSSRGRNTAARVGGGAAVGAIIGAIAGGGAGAAIGAGVGAGGGAVWNGVTRGQQIKIPAEAMLEFQLEQPVTITVRPRSTPAAQ
jgi:BON domain-containing protein